MNPKRFNLVGFNYKFYFFPQRKITDKQVFTAFEKKYIGKPNSLKAVDTHCWTPVDKLNMNQQSALAEKKVNEILGCMRQGTGKRSREVSFSLYCSDAESRSGLQITNKI